MGPAAAKSLERSRTGDPHPRVSPSRFGRAVRSLGAIALALGLVVAGVAGVEAATKKKKSSSKKKSTTSSASTARPVALNIRTYTGPQSTRLVVEMSKAAKSARSKRMQVPPWATR